MSTKLLEDSNLNLLLASLNQALWHALAFRRAASVRALGAPRAHVLHARAPSRRVPLTSPHARSGPSPLTANTPAPSLAAEPPLEPHSAAVRSAMAASGRPQQAPAMDGAAQATLGRQLAPEAVLIRELASAAIPSLDMSRCKLQNGGSPFLSTAAVDPIHDRRGTDLVTL